MPRLRWPFTTKYTTVGFSRPSRFRRVGRDDVKSLRQAAEEMPNDVTLRMLLGTALSRQGQFEPAVVEFREVVRILANVGPSGDQNQIQQKAMAHLGAGNCLNELGAKTEAVGEWENAIALDPGGVGQFAKQTMEANP